MTIDEQVPSSLLASTKLAMSNLGKNQISLYCTNNEIKVLDKSVTTAVNGEITD